MAKKAQKSKKSAKAKEVLPSKLLAKKPEAQMVCANRTVSVDEKLERLGSRVYEVEGDLVRVCELLGKQGGDPFASVLKEIVSKRQGAANA